MADHDTHDHTGVTGVPSGTSPTPTTIELGHASDTTLARVSAGVISVEGNRIFAVGAADVPIADGGTGASTAAAAATALGVGTGDSPQFTAVNVGAATDTTVTRVSAGVIAVEGKTLLTAVLSARARRVSGGITANSTTWANLDTGMDLTIAAATGDILEVSINGIWGAEAPLAILNVATIVAAAPVNFLGSGEPTTTTGNGLMGWAKLNASTYTPIGGSVQYAVQAGDISGGNVLLRLRYRVTNASGVTVLADATSPFQWAVTNLKV